MASPLILQPDGAAGKDSMMIINAATTNYGANAEMDSLTDAGSNARRAIIQFDISSLPVGATITSAIMTLYIETEESADEQKVHRVTRSWVEGDGSGGSGVTWNTYDGSNNWTSAGGDFDGTADATTTPGSTSVEDPVAFTITDLVNEWYTEAAVNYGMIVKLTSEAAPLDGLGYYTSDHTTAALRPKLVIDYTLPSGVRRYYSPGIHRIV